MERNSEYGLALPVYDVARLTHEAQNTYKKILGEEPLPEWERCSPERKETLINAVMLIVACPNITAEQLHGHWTTRMANDGWTYGPAKDEKRRLHPCMLPWSDLPFRQRFKDRLMLAIVKVFVKENGHA